MAPIRQVLYVVYKNILFCIFYHRKPLTTVFSDHFFYNWFDIHVLTQMHNYILPVNKTLHSVQTLLNYFSLIYIGLFLKYFSLVFGYTGVSSNSSCNSSSSSSCLITCVQYKFDKINTGTYLYPFLKVFMTLKREMYNTALFFTIQSKKVKRCRVN